MIEIPKSFDRASALVNAWLIAAPSRARGGLRSRDIRTASLLTTVSVSGKRDSEGQRQLAQNRLQAGKGLHGDRNADVGARQLRAFWKSQGNLAVRKSAWWWTRSDANPSPHPDSRTTGKNTGNFATSGFSSAVFVSDRRVNAMACSGIPCAWEQGISRRVSGKACQRNRRIKQQNRVFARDRMIS